MRGQDETTANGTTDHSEHDSPSNNSNAAAVAVAVASLPAVAREAAVTPVVPAGFAVRPRRPPSNPADPSHDVPRDTANDQHAPERAPNAGGGYSGSTLRVGQADATLSSGQAPAPGFQHGRVLAGRAEIFAGSTVAGRPVAGCAPGTGQANRATANGGTVHRSHVGVGPTAHGGVDSAVSAGRGLSVLAGTGTHTSAYSSDGGFNGSITGTLGSNNTAVARSSAGVGAGRSSVGTGRPTSPAPTRQPSNVSSSGATYQTNLCVNGAATGMLRSMRRVAGMRGATNRASGGSTSITSSSSVSPAVPHAPGQMTPARPNAARSSNPPDSYPVPPPRRAPSSPRHVMGMLQPPPLGTASPTATRVPASVAPSPSVTGRIDTGIRSEEKEEASPSTTRITAGAARSNGSRERVPSNGVPGGRYVAPARGLDAPAAASAATAVSASRCSPRRNSPHPPGFNGDSSRVAKKAMTISQGHGLHHQQQRHHRSNQNTNSIGPRDSTVAAVAIPPSCPRFNSASAPRTKEESSPPESLSPFSLSLPSILLGESCSIPPTTHAIVAGTVMNRTSPGKGKAAAPEPWEEVEHETEAESNAQGSSLAEGVVGGAMVVGSWTGAEGAKAGDAAELWAHSFLEDEEDDEKIRFTVQEDASPTGEPKVVLLLEEKEVAAGTEVRSTLFFLCVLCLCLRTLSHPY